MMAGVLGPEVIKELKAIHCVAKALGAVKTSPHASFSPDDGTITVSQQSGEDTAAVLGDIGKKLAAAAERLADAIEAQMGEFFNHMREKEASSVVGLLRTRSVVPDFFKVMGKNEVRAGDTNAASRSCEIPEINGSMQKNINSLTSHQSDLRGATTLLQTCLFLMMESVLTRVNAVRAAVYIGDVSENPRMLCRVAQIHADDKLPLEVSYANSSTLITAVQGGMAVNFNNTKMHPNKDDREANGHSRPFEAHLRCHLRVQSGIVVPIGNYGCVLVAEKPAGMPQGFTSFDEHHVWALAILCEGLIPRYPRDVFVKMSWSPAVRTLRHCSRLPSILKPLARASTLPRTGLTVTSAPSLDTLASVPRKLTILRASGNSPSIIGDPKGIPRKHMTTEGIFREAAEYVRNIEDLWQKAVHEANQLQQVVEEHVRNLEEKTHQITLLEEELRRLKRHAFSL
ncbi:hypothetical protein C3747_1g837 [Trypanosoma cruzi]|uniref:Uncharacterized protein n=3 Tax=Trypanosoma cruzi TaxID=5693 RepID=Q4DJZ4_TRYCC|nr:hypothetical protein, conserved [Trypanosoma cruzi]EAN92850.1 hypothetical protein, conserved [Trypanosoma cruzi]PWV21789.1 hypothetical protein C3747_1g837 [Trypanosoma cruzi]|eukprot:XP_814701.1 hypothetical protein [Trypanosoma cruzi strain CL Brener]